MDHEDLVGTIDASHAYDAVNGVPLAESPVASGDIHGHGTHVCGIVAGQANNGIGIAGASYNARVLPVKVFNDVAGVQATASTRDVVEAYGYLKGLVDSGSVSNLRVINLSLGYYPKTEAENDPLFEQAITSMRNDYNVLTVCAGGNGKNGVPLTEKSLPSDYDACLAVTSLDRDGGNTYGSDYNEYKDISAPGSAIVSTYARGSASYATLSGTSMASPLVAGIAALMWAADPSLSVDQVVAALEATADPIVDAENDRTATSGSHGAVNAQAAVAAVSPQPTGPVAEKAQANNVALLVRFADDATGDGDTGYNASHSKYRTKWEYFVQSFNEPNPDAYVKLSFRSYLNIVSAGAYDVVTDFPQTQPDGRVEYLTLSGTRASYRSDYQLVSETLRLFNEKYPNYDTSHLAVDGSGYLNNLLIIPTIPSGTKVEDKSDPLWPHKADLYGMNVSFGTGVNAKDVGVYNIIDTSSLEVSSTGVIAHEFLHTLGAKDYYRDTGSGKPVGVWDVMAESQAPRSWPLAITRERLGWTTIPEKSQAGTYTLYEPGTGREQAFLFKSPLSDSEYFVAEYRRQGSNNDMSSLDRRIGGSGLIVYRVNPAFADEGNIRGNDYVYLFRPGETGLGDAAGDVTNAQITATGSRTSMGVADLSKGIVDDALCYSNGQNSGIVIQATSQTDDSITFTLTYPDYTEADLWSTLANADGTGGSFGSDVTDVQVVADDANLYALVESSGGAVGRYQVMKHDGADWADLGVVGADLSHGQLAAHDGAIYFMAADYSAANSGLVLKKLEGGSWNEVARLSTNSPDVFINDPALGFIGDDLYVLADRNNASVQLYRLNGTALQTVGATLPVTYLVSPGLFDMAGSPAVAYGDYRSTGGKSGVLRLENGVWKEKSTSVGLAHTNSVVVEGGKSYVYQYFDQAANPRISVFDTSGAFERSVELPQFKSCVLGGDLAAANGFLYLTVIEGQEASATAKTYYAEVDAPDAWIQLGGDVYAGAGTVSTSLRGNDLMVGTFSYVSGSATLKYHAALKDGSNPSDPPVLTSVEAFVTRLYSKVLGRAPDVGGLNAQCAGLLAGIPAAGIAWNFFASSEFASRGLSNADIVETAYQTMLDRGSDPAGKADWTSKLDAGMSPAAIVSGFAASLEFRGLCERWGVVPGALAVDEARDVSYPVTSFASRLYSKVLGRAPDAGGLNAQCAALLSGASAAGIAWNFFASGEFASRGLSNADIVETAYQTMLDRGSDPAGKADWTSKLDAGMSPYLLVAGFANSFEFGSLCARYGMAAGPLPFDPAEIARYSGHNIMGTSSPSTIAQMVAYFNSNNKTYHSEIYAAKGAGTIDDFCRIVYEEATVEGVRAEVLFCQAMKETGWFRFGGSVQPEQCNFGGLGATSQTEGGATFSSVREGLRAQVQHLKLYASTDDLVNACIDPRWQSAVDRYGRGSAPNLEDLNGKWAVPGDGYGERLYDMTRELLSF